MDPQNWHRVQKLFAKAADLPAVEEGRFSTAKPRQSCAPRGTDDDDAQTWNRVWDLFAKAVALPAAERKALLDRETAAMRAELNG